MIQQQIRQQTIESILTKFISENINLESIFRDYRSKFLIFYLIAKGVVFNNNIEKQEREITVPEWGEIRKCMLTMIYALYKRNSHRFDSLEKFFRYYTQSIQSTIRNNLPQQLVDETNVQSIIQKYRSLIRNPSLLMNIFSEVTQIDLKKKRIVEKLFRNHKKKLILFYLLSKIQALKDSQALKNDDYEMIPQTWKQIQKHFFEYYCTPQQIQKPFVSFFTKKQSPSSILHRLRVQDSTDEILHCLNEIRRDYRRLWYIRHLLPVETFPTIPKQLLQKRKSDPSLTVSSSNRPLIHVQPPSSSQYEAVPFIEHIGEGLSGAVFKGKTTTGKQVAIKTSNHVGESFQSQFQKMKQIHQIIPKYVPIPYYYDKERNRIVMQLLGPPLWITLDTYNKTPQIHTTFLNTTIMNNLRTVFGELQDRKIRHGDLHFNNIMVNTEDGSVKIIDWSRMERNEPRFDDRLNERYVFKLQTQWKERS